MSSRPLRAAARPATEDRLRRWRTRGTGFAVFRPGCGMTLDLLREPGLSLDKQRLDWKSLVPLAFSKLDDDAFTRIRVILAGGLERGAVRFQHGLSRLSDTVRSCAAEVRRVEHQQEATLNALLPPDQSPSETAVAFEQAAVEVTASLARTESDARVAAVLRMGVLEDLDHLYRFAALLDRLEARCELDPPVLHGRRSGGPDTGAAPPSSRVAHDALRAWSSELPHAAPRPHRDRRCGEPTGLLRHGRSALRGSARSSAVRRDRLDRGATRHPLRIAPPARGEPARDVAGA